MDSFVSKANRSYSVSRSRDILNESDATRLQREVDNFTRKLEQEKRRLFTVEETYAVAQREYRERAKRTDMLKPAAAMEKKNMTAKIRGLEHQLEQFVLKYNDTVAMNQNLHADIDVVRRERVTLDQVKKMMSQEVNRISKEAEEKEGKLVANTKAAEKLKEKIIKLKDTNEHEHSIYVSEYKKLQRVYKDVKDRKRGESKDKTKKVAEKLENLDTQNILKRRLQRIILNNKEKIQVIEQYLKNMKLIDEAFSIIKETSGITDIDEILSTFIKSEEQNYSLFNYVNVLTQDIDFLEESNKDLELETTDVERELENKQRVMEKVPEVEVEKQKLQDIIFEREQYINEVRNQLYKMRDPLENVLKAMAKSQFCSIPNLMIMDNFILNEQTVDYYLSIFETMINKLIPYLSKMKENKNFMTTGLLLDDVEAKSFEKRTNPFPNAKEIMSVDETSLDQTPFLEAHKFKELASEIIDKYKERSILLGNSSLLDKSTKENPNTSKL